MLSFSGKQNRELKRVVKQAKPLTKKTDIIGTNVKNRGRSVIFVCNNLNHYKHICHKKMYINKEHIQNENTRIQTITTAHHLLY